MTAVARFAVAVSLVLSCALAHAAGAPREMHGMSDAFVTPGIALAWGVLRSSADAAVVDVRMIVDPMTYPRVNVVGRDPFSSRERLLASSPTAGLTDVRIARATFERYPRTEFRFFATAKSEPAETPILIVYFVGVPDTTPEFASESKLDAYLTERVVRAKAAAPKSP